jgi:transcriptional regulator with XRE-family HTH domain
MATKAQHSRRYSRVPVLLRALREEAGLTQRQLGAALDRPQSWIYNCETGNRRVDVAEFCDWCRACRVEPAVALARFLRSR